jgi:hypothetical protein
MNRTYFFCVTSSEVTSVTVFEELLRIYIKELHFAHQYKEFGLEGNEMWLAASADRRVSVWAADWMKDKCELLDWLTFPAPANPEVNLFIGICTQNK